MVTKQLILLLSTSIAHHVLFIPDLCVLRLLFQPEPLPQALPDDYVPVNISSKSKELQNKLSNIITKNKQDGVKGQFPLGQIPLAPPPPGQQTRSPTVEDKEGKW